MKLLESAKTLLDIKFQDKKKKKKHYKKFRELKKSKKNKKQNYLSLNTGVYQVNNNTHLKM